MKYLFSDVYRSPGVEGFSRDGFGRQSMSEKRKGHGDPRSSEIYQKVRGLKELNKGNKRSAHLHRDFSLNFTILY